MITTDKVIKFVKQRAGLNFADYGDVTIYRREAREITRDLHDFNELLAHAQSRVDNFDKKLTRYLKETSGRLLMNKKGELEYCTGQYFPTEYRPAASGIVATILFGDYANEVDKKGKNVYETGHDIRKALKLRGLSRRAMKHYFN